MSRSKLFIICAFKCSFILYGQDEGLNNFNEEKFLQAENYYDTLLLDDENNYKAHFGKGASQYMLKNLEKAKTSFNEVLQSGEDELKSKAFYNLGNISYKNKNYEEALAFYRKALELNPSDDEARYNYEYLKYQKDPPEEEKQDENNEDKQEENPENNEEKNQQNEKNDEEDKKDSQDKDEENDSENSEEQKEEERGQKNDSNNNNTESQQKPQDEKNSQDLKKAESILDAIKNDEKVMQKQLIQKVKTKKLLKDW